MVKEKGRFGVSKTPPTINLFLSWVFSFFAEVINQFIINRIFFSLNGSCLYLRPAPPCCTGIPRSTTGLGFCTDLIIRHLLNPTN